MPQSLCGALLVDDDPTVLRDLRATIGESDRGLAIETRPFLNVAGDFDVYFIDLEFCGDRLGIDLIDEVRRHREDAYVVVISGHLDDGSLKDLVNAGCDFACDKNSDADLDLLGQKVWDYLSIQEEGRGRGKRGFIGVLAGLVELVGEMNGRMKQLERAGRCS